MSLPEIDLGPTPTDEALEPFLSNRGDPGIARMMAELEWRADLQARDPNAFPVPFATEAFPQPGAYNRYLASPFWRRIRDEELRKAGHRCAACQSPTKTIHHRDYRPRVIAGKDRAALIALCTRCHERVHQEESWNDSERVLRELVERGSATEAVRGWRPCETFPPSSDATNAIARCGSRAFMNWPRCSPARSSSRRSSTRGCFAAIVRSTGSGFATRPARAIRPSSGPHFASSFRKASTGPFGPGLPMIARSGSSSTRPRRDNTGGIAMTWRDGKPCSRLGIGCPARCAPCRRIHT